MTRPHVGRDAPPETLRIGLLFLVVFALPTALILGPDPVNENFDTARFVFGNDLPLAALLVAVVPAVARSLRQRARPGVLELLVALEAFAFLSLALHPTLRGTLVVFRLAGVVAVAFVVAEAGAAVRRALGAALVAVTSFEIAISVGQLARGRAAGLAWLGEIRDPFTSIAGHAVPQGTMVHPYVLAALGLVTAAVLLPQVQGWRRAAGLTVAMVPVGLTLGRAAFVGFGLMLTATAIRWRPGAAARRATAALALGFVLGAAPTWPGWIERARSTIEADSEASLTTDRGSLFAHSFGLIRSAPLTGVGPGRYVIALAEQHPELGDDELRPVHATPLAIAAELGVPAGLTLLMALALLGARARRAGALAVGSFAAVLPLLALDHLFSTYPQGLALLGLWIGAILGESRAVGGDRESLTEDVNVATGHEHPPRRH